jgi:pyruvate/2-oxoacid:ferredoxin oxidoreductase alpha subunit
LSTVNYTNPNLDLTVRVFDQFYDYDVNVPAAEYDIVHSYFLSTMTTSQAAGNFTVSLFRVAEDTGIPVLTLLEEFKTNNGMNINVNLAYYLNAVRSRATLLGVGATVTPNFYQARNVLP